MYYLLVKFGHLSCHNTAPNRSQKQSATISNSVSCFRSGDSELKICNCFLCWNRRKKGEDNGNFLASLILSRNFCAEEWPFNKMKVLTLLIRMPYINPPKSYSICEEEHRKFVWLSALLQMRVSFSLWLRVWGGTQLQSRNGDIIVPHSNTLACWL